MKVKKVLYYIPIIILIIYIISYGPLLTYFVNKYVDGTSTGLFPFECNDIMNKISIAIIIIASIIKLIFNKKKFQIKKLESSINITVFIMLIISILCLGIITRYA